MSIVATQVVRSNVRHTKILRGQVLATGHDIPTEAAARDMVYGGAKPCQQKWRISQGRQRCNHSDLRRMGADDRREQKAGPADAFLFHHDFPVIKGTRMVYLLGYWQAHSIVASVAPELRREFRLREPPSEQSRRMTEQIAAAPMPVSVHIRRGDYVTVFGKHAVLSSEYYEAAMARMRARFPNCSFFIFSDDAAYAREWVADRIDCVIVDHNDAATAHEDLWLMSTCRHHMRS